MINSTPKILQDFKDKFIDVKTDQSNGALSIELNVNPKEIYLFLKESLEAKDTDHNESLERMRLKVCCCEFPVGDRKCRACNRIDQEKWR